MSSFHGHEVGEGGSPHCPKARCMFIKANNGRVSARLMMKCPCISVRTPEGHALQPICFLTYVKSLNIHLVNRLDDYDQGIDAASIMFCHDSNGIMDNSYPGHVRDRLGVTSWGHVSSLSSLQGALGMLYWYRKYQKKYKIHQHIESFSVLRGIPETKRMIAQVLHTINGLLIKKFMAFAPEIVGYRDIADQTARLFKELFLDYCKPVKEVGGIYYSQDSVFSEIKDLLNFIKESFHKPRKTDRVKWLSRNFSNRAIGAFFGTEFRRLLNTVNRSESSENEDYTESLAWVFRCSILAQTRVLGYLPNHIAEIKRHNFRQAVNREVEKTPPEQCQLIYQAVQSHLDNAGVPLGLFKREGAETDGILQDAIQNVSVDIKQNASTNHTVSDGGKIEDARLLVKIMRENKWVLPVRDLEDHRVIKFLEIESFDDTIESWSRPVFWASYQIVLNFWIRRGKWTPEDYHRLPYGDNEYEEDILLAKILHISEPGKERNLTKCTAVYAWFLTPAGKMCQSILALLAEHRAGLEMSAHDWMHTRRISGESEESGFIYNPSTGRVEEDIIHSFKDWMESTDWIGKYVGLAHIRALMDFVDFPRKYKELVLRLIISPQPVEEVCLRKRGGFSSDTEDSVQYVVSWNGAIREGFMMGNPMTKSILHLIHVSELETVTHYLKLRGIEMRRGYPSREVLDRPRIPRVTECGAQVRAWKVPAPFMQRRVYLQ